MVYIVSRNGSPIKAFWTKTEVSEFLGVSRRTIIRKLEHGEGVVKDHLVTELPLNKSKRRKFR